MPCSRPRVLIHERLALWRWAQIARTERCGIPGMERFHTFEGMPRTNAMVTRLLVLQAWTTVSSGGTGITGLVGARLGRTPAKDNMLRPARKAVRGGCYHSG